MKKCILITSLFILSLSIAPIFPASAVCTLADITKEDCPDGQFACMDTVLYCCTQAADECKNTTFSNSPGTISCYCQPGTNDTHDCGIFVSSCNPGHIPPPSCDKKLSYDPCNGEEFCILPCQEGEPPGEGEACTNICASGYRCGPAKTCVIDTAYKGVLPFEICAAAGSFKEQCLKCMGTMDPDNPANQKVDKIWTGIGCISTDPKDFAVQFLQLAIGIAGGIALLLMVYGSFLVSTSAGDPKKSEEGKEIITGTIAGLLFIIFSAILLRLIGVEILSIPGL
jgi:hypothetical protein